MDSHQVAHLETAAKPEKRMVHMVCDSFSDNGDHVYSIYALDISQGVNNDGSPSRFPEPIFQLDDSYPVGMGIFSLGSKIYFFGGFFDSLLPSSPNPLNTYIFDTSEKTIVEGPFLKGPKFSPIVVHLNQRVYVISSSFGKIRPSPHFEVFDPSLQTWANLLDPPIDADTNLRSYLIEYRRRDPFHIDAHAVLGTTIYISMPVGIYSFDVEKPGDGWIYLPMFNGVSKFPFFHNAELVNENWFCLTGGYHYLLISYDPHEENGLTNGRVLYRSMLFPRFHEFFLFNLGNSEICMVDSWCNKNIQDGACFIEGAKLFIDFHVFQTGRFMEYEERPEKVAKQDTYISPSSYKVTFVTDDFDVMKGGFIALFPIKM